jgi:hypothetical protein
MVLQRFAGHSQRYSSSSAFPAPPCHSTTDSFVIPCCAMLPYHSVTVPMSIAIALRGPFPALLRLISLPSATAPHQPSSKTPQRYSATALPLHTLSAAAEQERTGWCMTRVVYQRPYSRLLAGEALSAMPALTPACAVREWLGKGRRRRWGNNHPSSAERVARSGKRGDRPNPCPRPRSIAIC